VTKVGFNMEREAELCSKESGGYRQAMKELGMKW
jgi:hypothetical protein